MSGKGLGTCLMSGNGKLWEMLGNGTSSSGASPRLARGRRIYGILNAHVCVIKEGYEFLYDLKVFRAVRILRVARILRKTRSVKELQKLVMMMATCLKALAWSFLFCFGFMTLWAMLLVEFVHPIIE